MTPTRGRAIALTLLVMLGIALGVAHWPHGPGLGLDDHGQYLLHARALAEGRPYADIGFLHTRYSTLVAPIAEPPGLPVLIAGLFVVAGQHTEAVRLILYGALALFGFCVYRYMRTLTSVGTASVVVAWTLTALASVHALDTMLADLPFCAALWLCFLLADGAPLRGWQRVALAGAAGALAFDFRMAALPLLPAAATAILARDDDERQGFLSVGVVWTVVGAAVMFGLPAAAVLGGETLRTPAVLWHDVLLNGRAILDGAREWLPLHASGHRLSQVLDASLLLITLFGIVTGLRERTRRVAWITGAWYVVMLVMLPTRASRYMWPLFPLLSLGFVEGMQRIVTASRRWRGREAVPAWGVALMLVIGGAVRDLRRPAPDTYTRLDDVTTMRNALALEDGGTHRLRVVVFSPRVMAWEDGYITMASFDAEPDEMLSVMRVQGITHVVAGDAGVPAIGTAGVARLVRERPTAFREVFRNPSFRVLALLPAGP